MGGIDVANRKVLLNKRYLRFRLPIARMQRQPENAPTMFQAAYWCDVVNQIGSLKKQNRLVFSHAIFYWIDWVSGCLTLLNCLMLLLPPLRPAERSILFSGKSVRLSDDARSAASSHAPKKGCGVREVRAANLHVGVAFLCLLSLAKQRK